MTIVAPPPRRSVRQPSACARRSALLDGGRRTGRAKAAFRRMGGCGNRSGVLAGGAERFATTRWNLVVRAASAPRAAAPEGGAATCPGSVEPRVLDEASAREA